MRRILRPLVLAAFCLAPLAASSPAAAAAIVVDASAKTITEGAPCIVANAYQAGECALLVHLDTDPGAGGVTVTVTETSAPRHLVVTPFLLTFTSANFSIDKRALMLGRQDADTAADVATLTLTAPGYDPATVIVTVIDDD